MTQEGRQHEEILAENCMSRRIFFLIRNQQLLQKFTKDDILAKTKLNFLFFVQRVRDLSGFHYCSSKDSAFFIEFTILIFGKL